MTLVNNTLFGPFKLEDPRPNQIEGLRAMRNFTKKWINDILKQAPGVDRETMSPVVMATGSGKTYTTGVHIRNMFEGRDALERIQKKEIPLNILILNDRTSLIDQLKKANIEGKGGYKPHFGADILDHAHIKVFHSKADKKQILNTNNEIVELDGEDSVQEFGQGKKDNIYFSTFQSTNKFKDEDLVFDVIMIDEGHHLKAMSYKAVVQEYVDKYEAKNGRKPLIIPMSATPDGIMNQVDPVINFTLAQHLASPYSPEVNYHLVTSSSFTSMELSFVNSEIQRIQTIEDIREKIKEIKNLKQYIEEHLAQFGGLKELTQDMISRVMENAGSLDHTIIFAPSIDDVDAITAQINELTGDDNTAVGFHSKIDETDKTILDGYESGRHKIIVAVDKLNEGIDMPQTRNVIFRRGTNSSRVFQQQFGRGLRGTKVSFYDYTGTMANFSWIGDINQQVQDIQDQEGSDKSQEKRSENGVSRTRKGIDILFGNMGASMGGDVDTKQIQLSGIIGGIVELDKTRDYDEMTRDECIVYLKKQLFVLNVTSISQLLSLGPKKFQNLFGISLTGRILKRILNNIGNQDLKELAEVLEFPQVSEQQKQEFKDLLKNHTPPITTLFQLLNFGSTKFTKEFGRTFIRQILGKNIDGHATHYDLIALGNILELVSYKQEMKELLLKYGVASSSQLFDLGVVKFNKYFSNSFIGKVLDRNIKNTSLLDLKELAEVLEFPQVSEQQKQEFKDLLKNHTPSITSTSQLLDFGPVRFKEIFSNSFIGKVLDRNIKNTSLLDLKELAEVLEFPQVSEQQKQEFKDLLKNHTPSITSTSQLLDFGPVRFRETFGSSMIGIVLGRYVRVNKAEIEEFAQTIGLISLDLKQEFKDLLKNHTPSITSTSQLLDFGPVRFKETFGVSYIGKALGRIIRNISISDLKELGMVLYDE